MPAAEFVSLTQPSPEGKPKPKSPTCQRKPLVQEVAGCLPPVRRYLVPDVADDDGEGEDEDAHEQEDAIGGHVDQLDFVHHGVGLVVNGPPKSRSCPILLSYPFP